MFKSNHSYRAAQRQIGGRGGKNQGRFLTEAADMASNLHSKSLSFESALPSPFLDHGPVSWKAIQYFNGPTDKQRKEMK